MLNRTPSSFNCLAMISASAASRTIVDPSSLVSINYRNRKDALFPEHCGRVNKPFRGSGLVQLKRGGTSIDPTPAIARTYERRRAAMLGRVGRMHTQGTATWLETHDGRRLYTQALDGPSGTRTDGAHTDS